MCQNTLLPKCILNSFVETLTSLSEGGGSRGPWQQTPFRPEAAEERGAIPEAALQGPWGTGGPPWQEPPSML